MPASHQAPTSEIADMIASGSYWEEPVPDPIAGLGTPDREAYWANFRAARAATDAVEEIGVVAMSLMGGAIFESLEHGGGFPELPEGSRKVIRLVEDDLMVIRRGSQHHKNLRDIHRRTKESEVEGTHPGFDALAEQALDPSVVHTHPAYDLRSAGWRRVMHISRTIQYMRPVFDGRLGICVGSIFVQSSQDLEHAKPDVIPLVPIGATFVRGTRVSKIVRADVMEATGIVWRDDAPKKPRKKDPHTKGLLPRLAPGLSM